MLKQYRNTILTVLTIIFLSLPAGCTIEGERDPRLSLFIGVDISGSFVDSGHFEDSLTFLSHYIYAHLNGLGELEKPNVLYVSSIGGAKPGEPKTFYPIQVFENKSIEEIENKLHEIFPKEIKNPFTDFNAFFDQVAQTIRNKRLVLRPVSVVMISDGIPDLNENGMQTEISYRDINLRPLERLSRNITLRLLYTNPVTAKKWQSEIPRRRVKIWTQDAKVMTTWNDSTIYLADKPIEKQERWLEWTAENVNFGVPTRRVD